MVAASVNPIPALMPDGVIIYVDTDATGANNGTSWSNAYTNLQLALERATAGDQIWVAEGIYKPTVQVGGTGDRYRAFQMKNGVAIYGGFTGIESSLGQRDWVNHETILSGDIGIEGNSIDNSYHVFRHSQELALNSSAILDGFIIKNGITLGYGGGMYNEFASPTLVNCLFFANSANFGGGMYNDHSSPTLMNCVFANNTVGTHGGGMYNSSSSPILSNCTFSANSALNSGGGMGNTEGSIPVLINCSFENNEADRGGGMHNHSSDPVLQDCLFKGNIASSGGGMFNYSSSPTLNGCVFFENRNSHYGGGMYNQWSSPKLTNTNFLDNNAWFFGGGMYNLGASPELTKCTFLGNSADYGGGMHNKDESSPVLTSCSFLENTSGYNGGGMSNNESTPVLTNCTFFGNSADYLGGGIYNQRYSSPTLTNCSFSANSADNGGGMYNIDNSAPVITNCILWGDIPNEITNGGLHPPSPLITYSDIEGGADGTGNLSLDPQWISPSNGDFHLGENSPCIDSGNNTAPHIPSLDFEGHPRIVDGNDDEIAIVDMGVDELLPPGYFKYIYLPMVRK